MTTPLVWMFEYYYGKPRYDFMAKENKGFNGREYPVVATNFMTNITLAVSDADMVKDLFTTKNSITDKDGMMLTMFKDSIGESFVFSQGDESWRAKRKACAHAFYKERLIMMLKTLKEKITEPCQEWLTKIRQSESKSTVIDMADEFEKIFSKNIIHIAFGEDVSD